MDGSVGVLVSLSASTVRTHSVLFCTEPTLFFCVHPSPQRSHRSPGPGYLPSFDPDPALTLALVSPLFSAPRLAPASSAWCVRACVPCTEEPSEKDTNPPALDGALSLGRTWVSRRTPPGRPRPPLSSHPTLPSSAPISSPGPVLVLSTLSLPCLSYPILILPILSLCPCPTCSRRVQSICLLI